MRQVVLKHDIALVRYKGKFVCFKPSYKSSTFIDLGNNAIKEYF